MPETRLAKTRRSLPEGYQFGDAAPEHVHTIDRFDVVTLYARCRCGAVCDIHAHPRADQWDVTNFEPFTTDRDPGDETPTRRLRRRSS